MKLLLGLGVCISFMAVTMVSGISIAAESKDGVLNKVIAGYQGWFAAEGDNSPRNRWVHWAGGSAPSPNHQSFELYPYLGEYEESSLFQTGYQALGNGKPAKLFSTHAPGVVDTHFRWMKEYGIDGAALQRFGVGIARDSDHMNAVAALVKEGAEKHDRVFYLMYDTSGMNNPGWVKVLQEDFTENIEGKLQLTKSPAYATQNGKPVVCIWGLGFTDRIETAEQTIEIINWFKAKGFYVIGGVPTYWRIGKNDSRPGFLDAYCSFDALSPWTVGRFGNISEADNYYKTTIKPDAEFCRSKGIDYQPVIFSGFAWSNWNGGRPNQIPRAKGSLLWRQATNLKREGFTGTYIAMFDEYDEATAIAKAAEDSSMIPRDQYFLTLSADGSYVSSDFYLRLSGAVGRLLKGELEISNSVPVPLTEGPTYFRSSFETVDAKLSRQNTPIESEGLSDADGDLPICRIDRAGTAHRGVSSVKIWGRAQSGEKSMVTFGGIKTAIPVSKDTKLGYWFRPESELGRKVIVDVLLSDGSTLSKSAAVDYSGIPMGDNAGRGTKGKWTMVRCDVGRWLEGREIKEIVFRFESAGETGEFLAYIDDLVISEEESEFDIAMTPDEQGEVLIGFGLVPKASIELAVSDLSSYMSRYDALDLLLGILGVSDNTAVSSAESGTVFKDLDQEQIGKVSYAYRRGIVKGVSKDEFYPYEPATVRQFLAMCLRALGYGEDDKTAISEVTQLTGGAVRSELDDTLDNRTAMALAAGMLLTRRNGAEKMLVDEHIDNKVIMPESLQNCADFNELASRLR